MEEKALVVGIKEGWKYAGGYSAAAGKKVLDRASTRLKAQGEADLVYDVDGEMMRDSLLRLAIMLQPEAGRAIARWDELRKEKKEKAEQEEEAERGTAAVSWP
jgi:hypothetical protein